MRRLLLLLTLCPILLRAAPTTPTGVTLTAAPLHGQVGIAWTASAGATSYHVKRAAAAGGPFSNVGSPTATSFTDTTAAAGTRYFYRVTAVDGTGEGAASVTISTVPVLVVDNADASGVTLTGAWSVSSTVPGFYGTNYLLDGNTGATGGKSVRFTPTLAFAGRYDVYLRWTQDPNRASNVRVDVNFTAGTTFLKVNEQANGGAWVKLGAFDFAAGASGNVLLRNDGANGWVVADAVQFVLNEQPLPGYTQLAFEDEFEGLAYDPAVWSVYDNRPNNFVSGGQLHLTTVLNGTDWVEGGLYTSQFMQRFGYFETVMQIARDDGLNNAFWLNTPFSHDNAVDRLEIDITEAHFHEHNHMNVHDWRPVHVGSGTTQTVPDIYPGYHAVGLEWAANGVLRWYWDGVLARTMAASQLAGYESMTPLQVMFSTKVISFAGTPGPLLDGSSMDIANVRVWMKPGWTGAIDGNWGTGSNWGPDGVPGAGEAAIFNSPTTRTTVSLASDKSVKELYFSTPQCPAMTLNAGAFKFLLGALGSGTGIGGVVVNGDVTTAQTILTSIEAQNDLTFANYSTGAGVALDVNGAISSSAGGRTLVLAGNGLVNLGGSISSQFGSVVKVNAGAAWLRSANAHTGVTDIQNGSLVAAANGALGATGAAAETTVANGATLALADAVNYTSSETIHLAGNGETGSQGALDVAESSSVSFSGSIVLEAAARIGSGSGSGTLTLASDLDTTPGAFALSFAGAGTIVMNGAISGAGNVTKTGSGTLRLNSNATHTGTTTVSQGMLITTLAHLPGSVTNNSTLVYDEAADSTFANNWAGTGTVIKQGAGTVTVAAPQTTTGALDVQGGTVKLAASEQFSSSLDLIVGGGTFDLNAFSETVGPVVLSGGSIVNSTGTSSQFLAGTAYDVRSGAVSARLGGNAALTKTTAGTVTLSGANTFTLGTTVQAGLLELTGSLNSGVIVDGGTLGLGAATGNRTVNGSLAVNAGGALRIRLNGPTAGTQYDQLRLTNAASTVTLAGALDLIAAPGLAAGGTFRILDNNVSNAAVTGTFASLPQNAEFYEDGQWWRISYTGGTGNDVVLTRIAPTAWQSWQAANFSTAANDPLISGYFADVDLDGIGNLLEFSLALDPSIADVLPASAVRDGASIDYTYTRSKAAVNDGVTFAVEWSDNLVENSWSTSGVTEQILADNSVVQTVKVLVPAGSGGRRFVHLQITKP